MRPPGLNSEGSSDSVANAKGKGKAADGGAFLFDALSESGYGDDDEDDCASLASDTEWEGWRRELEMDLPPKALSTILSVSDATPKAGPSLAVLKEESVVALVPPPVPVHTGGDDADGVPTDEEDDEMPDVKRRNDVPIRRSSLKVARKIVVDGVAGKGLIMPRTNAYASWNSFTSTSSSFTSSFLSHEEYRPGEGSDTNANRRPRLPPLVVGQGVTGIGRSGTLARAKSATVFSSRQNVPLPTASLSAPLSAAFDNKHHSDADQSINYPDDLLTLDPDVMLPGLGGGLGNPALFPPFANMVEFEEEEFGIAEEHYELVVKTVE
ncbi:hypothetical protein FRC17_006581 [Serendipita sp. 399]|nr:hypothetical protein FRC17_006581 [Serendipita sp. 399]